MALNEKTSKWKDGLYKKLHIFLPQFFLSNVTVFLTYYWGYYYSDGVIPVPGSTDLASRLAFGLRCAFPMALILLVFIHLVAMKRATSAAVNPLSGNESTVQVEKNVLTNTLEQFAFGFALLMTAATYLDTSQHLKLLPIYSFVFVTARVVFRLGYGMHDPIYRGLGISAQFTSNLILLAILLHHMWTYGFLHGLGKETLENAMHTGIEDHCHVP